jgi:hypothetical protein
MFNLLNRKILLMTHIDCHPGPYKTTLNTSITSAQFKYTKKYFPNYDKSCFVTCISPRRPENGAIINI